MVFENHKDMTPSLLEPFIKSESITIPILVDEPDGSGVPKTMAAYGMQGTPTLLVFDRQGRLRRHYLGAVDDVRLGAEIMALCLEAPNAPREVSLAIEQRLADALVDPSEHQHAAWSRCCGGTTTRMVTPTTTVMTTGTCTAPTATTSIEPDAVSGPLCLTRSTVIPSRTCACERRDPEPSADALHSGPRIAPW